MVRKSMRNRCITARSLTRLGMPVLVVQRQHAAPGILAALLAATLFLCRLFEGYACDITGQGSVEVLQGPECCAGRRSSKCLLVSGERLIPSSSVLQFQTCP